ncbi:SWIM zinc finger family protein [Nocardioides sp.]|uniref:SWIM zinc finger family protein n=1 Tax=Nocardioides sp. TaxID=35761 RepID=UPI003513FAA1
MSDTRVTYRRLSGPRRGVRSWWGKAWQRAVEEAAYADGDLKRGRSFARSDQVGAITVDAGSVLAAVRDGDDAWTVQVAVPVLDASAAQALAEVVAATSGRVVQLLGGDLPHDLVEHAEEAGVELLPYGGEFTCTCTCDHYLDPCPHALAVLTQLGWLVDDEPLVLFALRGLPRDDLLARVGALTRPAEPSDGPGDDDGRSDPVSVAALADDVELAVDAALRARALLASFGAPAEADGI